MRLLSGKLPQDGFREWTELRLFIFMEEKIKPEALERAVPRLFSDKSCGEVFRIKGFVKNGAGQWMELNATPDSHTMQSIAVGQEVLIVIGEHLQEDKIREILKEEETCQS